MVSLLSVYCVGLPILTIIVAFSLDSLAQDLSTLSIQLSRQSTICQVRLTQAEEWLLVFIPFILTGCVMCFLNTVIFLKVKRVKDAAAMTKKQKTASDDALEQLLFRLAVLGLTTFATLCVVIISTSVYSEQLSRFSPRFATYFV